MSSPGNTLTLRLKKAALDDIPLGVVRLSLDGEMTYMNRTARELAGPGVDIGSHLAALELSPDSERILKTEVSSRRVSWRGSSYPITLNRSDLGTKVYVRVAGVPECDSSGTVIGSVGIISDVSMQRANLAIHEAIGAASSWEQLLCALDEKLRDVLAFDSIIISLVSAERDAVRAFYQRPDWRPEGVPAWRWWPMPAFVRADIDALLATRSDDIDALFEAEPYATLVHDDAATRKWRELGHRHMLRRPVLRNGRIVAIVSLFRHEDRPFTDLDIERMEQLPIGEAVNMAMALDHQKALAFDLDLIGRLGAEAGCISEVGRVLVEELRTNYGWEHVSLFRVHLDEGVVSIVHQAADTKARLPDDYAQPVDVGLLGYVARSGQPIRLGDVSKSAAYKEGIKGTRSEMCLPVPGPRVRWILNVESSFESAFASEEQAAVARVLDVAGLILDRTLALEFNAAVLESVADAVIQTTSRGEIQSANPACLRLLERSAESLVGTHLTSLISAPGDEPDPPGFAARLVSMPKLVPGEVELIPRDGTPIPVLLSCESLPPQIGGKVYVASDLRHRHEVQRMDTLRSVFRQVASETRLPLALAGGYLQELLSSWEGAARDTSAGQAARLVGEALRHLRRADLPLERVVRLASSEAGQELPLQAMSLTDFADKLVSELPEAQSAEVMLAGDASTRPALAARQELEFCAFSLLAFLLRMKAQRDGVLIRIGHEQARPLLSFELVDPHTRDPSPTRLAAKSAPEREFALAEPVIRALMQRMRGRFDMQQRDGLLLKLFLEPAEA